MWTLAMLTIGLAATWYGPETVTFDVQYAGNPYDIEKNDVRVRFIGDKGQRAERLAFYDAEKGVYRAVLVADMPGAYRPVLVHNGKESGATPEPATLTLEKPLGKGFIRRDPAFRNRFQWDNGTPYYPFGHNLGWQGGSPVPPMVDQVKLMADNGLNWTRIWACSWDGKNPWVPAAANGEMTPEVFQKWDDLAEACDRNNVAWQFVLFHHGMFSTTTDSNWNDHPWNAAKGGFLKSPKDFFTDPEAKRRAKMWLRYAIARYGHEPQIMAWELFNEVQWVDAWKDVATRPSVVAWHNEMADYIRSLDPYRHLVTTSSTSEAPSIYERMDFEQPHTYPASLRSIATEPVGEKPLFFGEFGPSGRGSHPVALREAVLASIFANHAGAAQYWYWDEAVKQGLYPEFKRLRTVIDTVDIVNHPAARPLRLRVSTREVGDLRIVPGRGWEKSDAVTFDLRDGELPTDISKLSGYLQGKANEEMGSVYTFQVKAAKPAEVVLATSGTSSEGAEPRILIDGEVVATRKLAGRSNAPGSLSAKIPAGDHTVVIDNIGPDWVSWRSIQFKGMGPAAEAMAVGDSKRLAIWLTAENRATVSLGGLNLPNGPIKAKMVNLETGEVLPVTVNVEGFRMTDYEMPAKEIVLVIDR